MSALSPLVQSDTWGHADTFECVSESSRELFRGQYRAW
jgi:hypothetical protein